jgi:hypothetical protein
LVCPGVECVRDEDNSQDDAPVMAPFTAPWHQSGHRRRPKTSSF